MRPANYAGSGGEKTNFDSEPQSLRWHVLIVAAVEHHDRDTAVLHELMAGAGLVCPLLWRVPGRACGSAQAERQAHPAFGVVVVGRGDRRIWFWIVCHVSVGLEGRSGFEVPQALMARMRRNNSLDYVSAVPFLAQ